MTLRLGRKSTVGSAWVNLEDTRVLSSDKKGAVDVNRSM